MPVRANIQLRAECKEQVKAKLEQLQAAARYGSVNAFIVDKLQLTLSTYHRFVTNLRPVTREIAESYLKALQFAEPDVDAMLQRIDTPGGSNS